MKTIFIETVSNGWIVRLHESCISYVYEPIAVFNRMTDLQAALPELLFEANDLVRPPQPVTPGGDRRPETIGGNERCPSA